MPEQPDNQTGRMLFTEFDVSDKGRPVAVLPARQPAGFIVNPLHSITQLASSLDLDFEDDDDASPPPRDEPRENQADSQNDQKESTGFFPFRPSGDDQELSIDQAAADRAEPDRAPPAASGVPTWEEYANAFRFGYNPRQTEAAEAARKAETAPPESVDEVDGDAPTAAYLAVDDGFDVLSALADDDPEMDMDEAVTQVMPRPRPAAPLPPDKPYGGVERVDDWYAPPENQSDPPPLSGDWFEPPDGASSMSDINAFLNSELFNLDKDIGGGHYGPTRRIERPGTEPAASPADSIVDIFSGVDIDEMWNNRLESPRPRSDTSSDTRSIDLFSDVDLDLMWNARKGGPPTSESARLRRENAGKDKEPDDTVILDGAVLDAAKTAILPGKELHSRIARRARDAEDVDVLTDLDEFLDHEQNAMLGDDEPEEDVPFAPAPRAKLPDYLDVMDELDDGVADVQAPSVDSSAIQGAAGRRKGAGRETDVPDDFDLLGEEAASDSHAAAADDGAVGDLVAMEEGMESPSSSTGARRAVTTDDLLDMDFDDAGIDAGVSAPVIDDSAIDPLKRGPRPGTEEMQAIMGEGAFGEGGEGAAGAGPAADEVEVNPMDVFANMDDMDFSDDMDDDMRAMLDDEEEDDGLTVADVGNSLLDNPLAGGAAGGAVPGGLLGKARYYVVRAAARVLPMSLLRRLDRMVAWGDNWWFYCDLLAAIIASASLAVIISYYVWYRV